MTNSPYFKNGLKFDDTLAFNLRRQIERVKMKKASLFVIDGGVGEGKTTLATECGMYLAEQLNQPFDIEQQVRQGGDDFFKGLEWCVENKRSIVVYDEAGDFNTRASLTRFNKNMNRVFETYRALGIIVILALPLFLDIDTSLMKKKILRFLIHCYGRKAKYGNYKVFSLNKCWWIKRAFASPKVVVPEDAYKCTYPNYLGHFKDLNPEDSVLLENHSLKAKKQIIKDNVEKEEEIIKDKEGNKLISVKEISEEVNLGSCSILKFVKDNNIEGERKGAKLYFKPEIIDEILNREDKRAGRKRDKFIERYLNMT